MTDETILQLANLVTNSAQVCFLAYLAARFHRIDPPNGR
jgi:hypothetical protein